MYELGNVIPRIIWIMALLKDTTSPFMFSKVNLKGGYWRMAINEADACNFAYVLPGAGPHEPIQLIIFDALLMGWSESPPFSCAAKETARDIIDEQMRNNVILLKQPMENIMMAIDWTAVDKLPNQPAATECDQCKFLSLIEVYIDDFIGVIQSTNKAHLLEFSRRILDGITKVFPPPILSGSKMAHPVSEKNLFKDRRGRHVDTPRCKRLNMVRQPPGSSMDVQVPHEHLPCSSTYPQGPLRQTAYKSSSVIVCQTHFWYL
jgi:hypothetical protein